MKRIFSALALLGLAFVTTADSQVVPFPQSLPPSTVIGRMPPVAGPAQAIPFSILSNNLSAAIFGFVTNGDSNFVIPSTARTVVTSASLTVPRTWTLPAAAAMTPGQPLCIADQAGGVTLTNTLTIVRAGSDTINNTANYVFTSAFSGICLTSDGSTKWTISNQIHQLISVKDAPFAAALDGTTDDTAAFTAALNSGASTIVVPGGPGTIAKIGSAGIIIPAGVSLIMDYGVTLKPITNTSYVVNVHAGGWFKGRIDTSGITWTGHAIDFDGANNNDTVPFRLNTRSGAEAILVGGLGAGTGEAVKLHADGVAGSRIMGVELNLKISGFEYGVRMAQNSADLSKFVNGNRIRVYTADTLRPLFMESSHANSYGVDGNEFWIQSQPRPGTTVPVFTVAGQDNHLDLLPYDWSTVVGTSPFALSIVANARNTAVLWRTDRSFIQNNSTDASLVFIVPSDSGGINLSGLRSLRTDNVVRMLGTSTFQFSNNVFLSWTMSTAATRNIIGLNNTDDLLIQATNAAGNNMLFDVPNTTGIYARRLNGTNVELLGPSTGLQMQSKRHQPAQGAAVASANNLALGADGNRFQISGTTQINLIDASNWQGGAIITLHFQGALTVKNNQVVSGNFKPIRLSGSVDFAATDHDQLTLQYDGTDQQWYELARTVI
jgi:hypothetical protein